MNNTRIDGRTSKTDNNKAAKSKKVMERNEDQYYTERYDTEPRSDKSTVAEFHCKETVDASAERYTDIKKACECGCGFGINASVFNKITARPERSCELKRTVTEKEEKALHSTADREDLFKR